MRRPPIMAIEQGLRRAGLRLDPTLAVGLSWQIKAAGRTYCGVYRVDADFICQQYERSTGKRATHYAVDGDSVLVFGR